MKGKVHFIQLGCDKNRVDGEVMLGILDAAGYEIVPDAELADAIVVNTCGFISEAVRESIDTVLEAAEYKSGGKCNALIVAGCMAARYKDEILKEIPEANAVLPVSEYGKIAVVLDKVLHYSPVEAPVIGSKQWTSLRLAGRKMTAMPHIAYVKISEGCDNRCTYCTIPSIRGAYTERPFDAVLDECVRLAADGAKELVLVAQDTARYSRIVELLREVSKITDVTWIRLMYAYPEHISDELIDVLASSEKICPYIDMPIQHASDTVLKRMGRKDARADLMGVINKLRKKIPHITLRTTLMVGFPGETETEYNELCDFVREIRFDRLGVFVFSPEDGTSAARMKGKVKKSEANARRDKLMLIQQEIHKEKQRSFIGQTIDVMADTVQAANREDAARGASAERGDSVNPTGCVTCIGRTVRDATESDAVVIFNAPADKNIVPGAIIKVRVTDADDYDLLGEMI